MCCIYFLAKKKAARIHKIPFGNALCQAQLNRFMSEVEETFFRQKKIAPNLYNRSRLNLNSFSVKYA